MITSTSHNGDSLCVADASHDQDWMTRDSCNHELTMGSHLDPVKGVMRSDGIKGHADAALSVTQKFENVSWCQGVKPMTQHSVSQYSDNGNVDGTQAENLENQEEIMESRDVHGSISSKDTQMAETLKWLSENYELAEGVCLPRCVLYVHYLDFCKRQEFKPAGAATFGKLIRQKFKNITTRRLGTRGQSKYHYYGIGIIESSIYYQSVYAGKGLTRFSGVKIKTESSNRKYSLSSKTGTLLPDFPSAYNLNLPNKDITEKMDTLLVMYRTHSQRILDSIITAHFEEIQNLLVHFWQGFPDHLKGLLHLDVTRHVIAVCDSILYTVLTDVLIPNTIQDLPENLLADIRAFLRSLRHWLQNSFDSHIPEVIKQTKYQSLQKFRRSMARQLVFIKMAQICRCQLSNHELSYKAMCDLDLIDFNQICALSAFTTQDKSVVNSQLATSAFEDFKSLLQKQCQIESYTDWIDSLVDKCVLKSGGSSVADILQQRASRFLLQWTLFGSLLVKELTLNSAPSFSFLHLMKLTLDEYVLLVIETQADKHFEGHLHKNLQEFMKNTEEIRVQTAVMANVSKCQMSSKPTAMTARAGPREKNISIEAGMQKCDEGTAVQKSCHGNTPNQDFFPSEDNEREDNPTPKDTSSKRSLEYTGCPPSTKQLPPYDHSPGYPTLAYGGDHDNHLIHPFVTTRPSQGQLDLTSPQGFHHVTLKSPVTPQAPTGYWSETSVHHPSCRGDPYGQLGAYGGFPYAYDTLLRGAVYQDGLGRGNNGHDCLSYESLTRPNYLLETLSLPAPALDGSSRPAVYYARQADNPQGNTCLAVDMYSNSLRDGTGNQFHLSNGIVYQDDVHAAANLPHFTGLIYRPALGEN